jgi:Lon protease-like protein
MFPLGTVLFPTMVLPLHVFEERYRVLVRHCLDADRTFGVVLIERGSEVGGGDVRTDVGTVAEIVEAARFEDGRYALAAVGTERLRVNAWLEDAPYPRADVELWPDAGPSDVHRRDVEPVVVALRRLLARLAERGEPVAPATTDLAEDLTTATFQAAAIAPLGPADRQRLLAAPTLAARVDLLATFIDDEHVALDRLMELEQPPEEGHGPAL